MQCEKKLSFSLFYHSAWLTLKKRRLHYTNAKNGKIPCAWLGNFSLFSFFYSAFLLMGVFELHSFVNIQYVYFVVSFYLFAQWVRTLLALIGSLHTKVPTEKKWCAQRQCVCISSISIRLRVFCKAFIFGSFLRN